MRVILRIIIVHIVSIECESIIVDSSGSDDDESCTNNNDKCADEETALLSNEDLNFAPGEHNTSISIFFDPHIESFTFIKIYADTIKRILKHLSHQKVLQSEICRYDRRRCDPYRLFHAASMLRIEKLATSKNTVVFKEACAA